MVLCCALLCLVSQSCLTLCDPMDGSPPGSSVHGILQARILEWIAISFSRGSSQPRDRTRSPAFQVDSLPSEPPGKSKNTGMGSLSLLQGILLTLKSNWNLLKCRQILYHLSYQGSHIIPVIKKLLKCIVRPKRNTVAIFEDLSLPSFKYQTNSFHLSFHRPLN